MRRVWLSTLVLAVCALAVGFVLTEPSRVAAEGQAAGSSAVRIRASEQMTDKAISSVGMLSKQHEQSQTVQSSEKITNQLYLPVIGKSPAPLPPGTIAGYVQKGPFILGSEITVRELDAGFVPTGRTFTGRIADSTGRFTVRGTLTSPFVEFSANGFYFNEVTGSLSAAPVNLLALADLRDSTTVNVNLLTHLENVRVYALLDSGLSFSAAKAQAQQEVLAAFNLSSSTIAASEALDISQAGEGNAILLAISVILQANRSEAQLTELLATFSNDLQADGQVTDAATRQALLTGMEFVKPQRAALRANILARYASLGALATVPNFEAYAFALDATAPLVTAPSSGNLYAQNVNPVTVVFSELMQHATLSSNSVRLSDSAGNPVSGSLTISDSASSTSVVFTPNVKLALGLYPLTVANTVQDLAGNPLSSEKVVNLTIVEEPITGLISRHSATTLGETTFFTATVGSGSNVVYNWSFGNGATGSGHVVTYTYSTLGTYTVVVTAANSVSSVATQTFVYNGWVLIPAGDFQMGCDSSNPAETCGGDEQPLHTVTLDTYFIDKYEVTNARYKACVDAGGCTAPWSVNSYTRRPYYSTSTYADYPVVNVTWYQASAFCAWAGGRLPTEAEWEKAARGSSDTRKYPWGDSAPDCTKLNYHHYNGFGYEYCVGDTSRVGFYPSGASPYGVMDMAGNVWEWVNDWYGESYYSVSPGVNPQGPSTGSYRVLRGGSWGNSGNYVRSASRILDDPDVWVISLGFRCVRSQ